MKSRNTLFIFTFILSLICVPILGFVAWATIYGEPHLVGVSAPLLLIPFSVGIIGLNLTKKVNIGSN